MINSRWQKRAKVGAALTSVALVTTTILPAAAAAQGITEPSLTADFESYQNSAATQFEYGYSEYGFVGEWELDLDSSHQQDPLESDYSEPDTVPVNDDDYLSIVDYPIDLSPEGEILQPELDSSDTGDSEFQTSETGTQDLEQFNLARNIPGQIARSIGPNPPTGGRIEATGPILNNATNHFAITQPFIDGVTGQPIPMANIGFIYDWGLPVFGPNYFERFSAAIDPSRCTSRTVTQPVRCVFNGVGPQGASFPYFYLEPNIPSLTLGIRSAAMNARIGAVAFGSNGSARVVWSDPIATQPAQTLQITNFRVDHLPPSGADFRVHFTTSVPLTHDAGIPHLARIGVFPTWPQSPASGTAWTSMCWFQSHNVIPNNPLPHNQGSMSPNRRDFWCDFVGGTSAMQWTMDQKGASGLPTGVRFDIIGLPGHHDTQLNANISHPRFRDVPPSPQQNYIHWLADTGITTGWADRTFRPSEAVNRQAMAAFLFRAAGSPAFTPPANPTFTDVARNHTFFQEIEWLASTGITTGWNEPNGTRTFRPAQPVTREAFAAFLHRFNGSPAAGAQANFRDVPANSQFARYISWMATTGISTGWDDGTFRPGQPVNRGALAAFLFRASRIGGGRWAVR